MVNGGLRDLDSFDYKDNQRMRDFCISLNISFCEMREKKLKRETKNVKFSYLTMMWYWTGALPVSSAGAAQVRVTPREVKLDT